jgi:predicted aldo/keto reductase-like oxidoreductase
MRAALCIQCQECEAKCPQGIRTSEWMPIIHEVLGENRPYVLALD